MARILFTWELGAASGHWAKIRPVAETLAQAGHEIYAALRKVDVVKGQWNSKLPLVLLQSPHLSAPQAKKIVDVRSMTHILHNVGFYDEEVLGTLVAAWRNLYSLVQPDVILFEHSPSALLAARGLDCKKVVLGTGFSSPPHVFPLPDLQPWNPPIHDQLQQDETKVLERMNQVIEKNDTKPLTQISQLYQDVDEQILMTFPELDHYGPRIGETYWGVWPSTNPSPPSWQRGTQGRRIFAYLRMFAGLPTLLQQLTDHEYDVIAYIPNCEKELLATFSSPSLRLIQQPINLREISEDCNLALLYAGAGTVANLLLQGVPSLNFPLHLEQSLIAYRLAQSNLGAFCRTNQPVAYGPAIESMLAETRFKQAAMAFAKRYENFDAQTCINSIAKRIEQFLICNG